MRLYLPFCKVFFSPASLNGQGIVAAPKAYFAKQSMKRVRRGTAKSPVFAIGKNGPQKEIFQEAADLAYYFHWPRTEIMEMTGKEWSNEVLFTIG